MFNVFENAAIFGYFLLHSPLEGVSWLLSYHFTKSQRLVHDVVSKQLSRILICENRRIPNALVTHKRNVVTKQGKLEQIRSVVLKIQGYPLYWFK